MNRRSFRLISPPTLPPPPPVQDCVYEGSADYKWVPGPHTHKMMPAVRATPALKELGGYWQKLEQHNQDSKSEMRKYNSL